MKKRYIVGLIVILISIQAVLSQDTANAQISCATLPGVCGGGGGGVASPLSLASTGTAGATTLNFGTAGTGFYGNSTTLSFSTGGALRFSIDSTGMNFVGDAYPSATVNNSTVGITAKRWAQVYLDNTLTAGGTTGAQTINKNAGSVNFAAAATSLVVTDSRASTTSIIFTTPMTNDATCKSFLVTRAAGSFTINANAACTAETAVGFIIFN